MGYDYRLEEQEQNFNDAKQRMIAEIAATFVARKEEPNREAAVERAREIFRFQSKGLHDLTGTTTTLKEAQMPVGPRDEAEKRQIDRIAQDLIEEGLVEDEGFES